ncbi:MAG TPA: L-threonylcarbamoyladenylate synthase [Bryobacteraceae bacterium]|nr:L-threonylcarbamoyladenylate synthase [Bryobacteraceae bacterium]
MKTNPDLDQAVALLRAGRLVAFPTETVYGLGANALDAGAVRAIYQAKGRPSTSPLIVHVSSIPMAKRVVAEWPEAAAILAARYWPGPLTLVLPKRPNVPDEVTAGLSTVGVRMPAHPLALALIRKSRLPLAAPSANRFTELSAVTAQQVRQGLGNAVDLVLDGGPCRVGIESTVLSLAGQRPVLLRPGMVSREQMEALIGPVDLPGAVADGEAHAAPGQHSKHYAPKARLRLGIPEAPEGAAYLWWAVERPAQFSVRMPNDPDRYAAMLYDTLHRADGLGVREIVVEPVPYGADWDGIRDRLHRAAAK